MNFYTYHSVVNVPSYHNADFLADQLWHFCRLFPYFCFSINGKEFGYYTDKPTHNDISTKDDNIFELLFHNKETEDSVKEAEILNYIFQKNKYISPDFLLLHFSLIPSSSISHDKTS